MDIKIGLQVKKTLIGLYNVGLLWVVSVMSNIAEVYAMQQSQANFFVKYVWHFWKTSMSLLMSLHKSTIFTLHNMHTHNCLVIEMSGRVVIVTVAQRLLSTVCRTRFKGIIGLKHKDLSSEGRAVKLTDIATLQEWKQKTCGIVHYWSVRFLVCMLLTCTLVHMFVNCRKCSVTGLACSTIQTLRLVRFTFAAVVLQSVIKMLQKLSLPWLKW